MVLANIMLRLNDVFSENWWIWMLYWTRIIGSSHSVFGQCYENMIANLMAEVENVVFWRNWLKAGFIIWYFSLRYLFWSLFYGFLFLVLVIDYFMVFTGIILGSYWIICSSLWNGYFLVSFVLLFRLCLYSITKSAHEQVYLCCMPGLKTNLVSKKKTQPKKEMF